MEELEVRQLVRGTKTINIAENDVSYLFLTTPYSMTYRIELTKDELKKFIDSSMDKREYENWVKKNVDRFTRIEQE
mgnify:CR=1 FL=1